MMMLLNIYAKFLVEDEIKHFWNEMTGWIESIIKDDKISDSLWQAAMDATSLIKMKRSTSSITIFKIAS